MTNFEFAQCACVLFDGIPTIEELEKVLVRWGPAGQPTPGEGEHGWALCGPGLTFSLRSGALVVVDIVDRPWPDDLAAAQKVPALGSAWRLGAFGAVATPGALARASDQPWLWDGAAAAGSHRGFIRIRTAHPLPGEDAGEKVDEKAKAEVDERAKRKANEARKRHDPLYELTTVTDLAHDVLGITGALALFVPGGEALRSARQVDEALGRKTGVGAAPIELWTNVRAVELGREGGARWLLLDTIGLAQLRIPDVEAIFQDGAEQPQAVEALLRGSALRLVAGQAIPPGSTTNDARGRRWSASLARGLVAPTRPVVRWLPEESPRPAEELLAKLATAGME